MTNLAASPGLIGASSNRLPSPPRDRRPALAVLAVLLIIVGALGSALVAYRSGDRVDVLVAARDIPIGQTVTAADFTVARVAADDVKAIDASARDRFIGTTATTDVPAGTLLNNTMFRVDGVLPAGSVVVGVVLAPTQRPAAQLAAGDVVRAYLVPRTSDGALVGESGATLLKAARVIEVGSGGLGSGDNASISLLVDEAEASKIMPAAAAGQVALARLPAGTKPTVDTRSATDAGSKGD